MSSSDPEENDETEVFFALPGEEDEGEEESTSDSGGEENPQSTKSGKSKRKKSKSKSKKKSSSSVVASRSKDPIKVNYDDYTASERWYIFLRDTPRWNILRQLRIVEGHIGRINNKIDDTFNFLSTYKKQYYKLKEDLDRHTAEVKESTEKKMEKANKLHQARKMKACEFKEYVDGSSRRKLFRMREMRSTLTSLEETMRIGQLILSELSRERHIRIQLRSNARLALLMNDVTNELNDIDKYDFEACTNKIAEYMEAFTHRITTPSLMQLNVDEIDVAKQGVLEIGESNDEDSIENLIEKFLFEDTAPVPVVKLQKEDLVVVEKPKKAAAAVPV